MVRKEDLHIFYTFTFGADCKPIKCVMGKPGQMLIVVVVFEWCVRFSAILSDAQQSNTFASQMGGGSFGHLAWVPRARRAKWRGSTWNQGPECPRLQVQNWFNQFQFQFQETANTDFPPEKNLWSKFKCDPHQTRKLHISCSSSALMIGASNFFLQNFCLLSTFTTSFQTECVMFTYQHRKKIYFWVIHIVQKNVHVLEVNGNLSGNDPV